MVSYIGVSMSDAEVCWGASCFLGENVVTVLMRLSHGRGIGSRALCSLSEPGHFASSRVPEHTECRSRWKETSSTWFAMSGALSGFQLVRLESCWAFLAGGLARRDYCSPGDGCRVPSSCGDSTPRCDDLSRQKTSPSLF